MLKRISKPLSKALLISGLYITYFSTVLMFLINPENILFFDDLRKITIRGSNIIGVFGFLLFICLNFYKFLSYENDRKIKSILRALMISIPVSSFIFHIIDISSIPVIVYLYGDLNILRVIPYAVDVFVMQQLVFAEGVVTWFIKDRIKISAFITAFIIFVSFGLIFGNLFKTTHLIGDPITYALGYIPFWILFILISYDIVKRNDK